MAVLEHKALLEHKVQRVFKARLAALEHKV